MAGSKAKFIYFSDPDAQGVLQAKVVNLDESNTRALGYVPITAADLALLADKRVQKLDGSERYINCAAVNSLGQLVQRRIIVPKADNTFFKNGGNIPLPVLTGGANATVESPVFIVRSAVGEFRSFAFIGDTGLNDGSPDI